MKIYLFCAYGMSTDVLVNRMKPVIAEGDEVHAFNINQLESKIGECDVALLAPQARMYLRSAKAEADKYGIPVDSIDMIGYGRGDGQLVYNQAKKLFENKK